MDLRHSFIITDTGDKELLFDCKFCNRKFSEKSLEKHSIICEKMSKSKRTPFNLKALRCKELNEKLKQGSDSFHNWGGGIKIPLNSSSSLDNVKKNPSHITCQFCSRNFIYESGIKHIKICGEHEKKKLFDVKRSTIEPRALNKKLTNKLPLSKVNDSSAIRKENISPKVENSSSMIKKTYGINAEKKSSINTQNATVSKPCITKPVKSTIEAGKSTISKVNTSSNQLINRPSIVRK